MLKATVHDLFAVIGELSVTNRVLEQQLAESRKQLIEATKTENEVEASDAETETT